ncbi:MAG TPA: hypothetical protein VMN37_09555 [Gemmatimonadales bacterium]|nr:hypothetical protein [Gemmatimonadales bacterium]
MPARRPPSATLLALLALLAGSPVAAQTSSTAGWRATPASVLKASLRSVAAAQSRHLAVRGTYAASPGPLAVTLEAGVRVDILAAGPRGWQARATHRDQPGRSCVIFVGRIDGIEAPRTAEAGEMAGEEGVPLCDLMR